MHHIQFIRIKRTEGLATSNINFGCDLTKTEITAEVFFGYKDYLINDNGYSPHTVNVRLRTLQRFKSFATTRGIF